MTVFTGALLMASSDSLSLGQAGWTKLSTTILPSGPVRTVTFPPGPESMVRLSASFCAWIGFAAICARNAATGSAGAVPCCGAFQGAFHGAFPKKDARSEAGKSCARKALPARVAESRSIARREVGFRKEFEDIGSPFDFEMVLPLGCGRHYTPFRDVQKVLASWIAGKTGVSSAVDSRRAPF